MPELPLLRLPAAEPANPKSPPRGGSSVARPNRARQGARLDPRFERLQNVAANPAQIMALREDPASIAPERAIVFEVEGSLDDFYAQAKAIGLDYLGDFEDDLPPSEDFFDKKKPGKTLSARVYLAMPDTQALQELLSLWNRFKKNERMPTGKGAWRNLFEQLVDVRAWGPKDRIPDESLIYWEEDLARAPDEPVRIELELWFYENEPRRAAAFARLETSIAAAGGALIHRSVIPEIRYDGALVEVPAQHAKSLIAERNVTLALADEVMFLRPQSVLREPGTAEIEGADTAPAAVAPDLASDEPLVALLDGFPVQNHARLAGRLMIDDPEGLEAAYPVARREHGTAMASLIVHGDLGRNEAAVRRPLYVRPILRPNQHGDERTDADRLVVDVIYQAVRRIKEGEADLPPVAPSVFAINLSLGDEKRPFARMMSPLARLLDFLSYRYRVLFLVSAGNVTHKFPVPAFNTSNEFEAATPEEREREMLNALNANKSQRTLLSPGESVNALTIGASNDGSAYTAQLPNGRYDAFTVPDLPNVASAMGLGFKRAVKPDLLFDGGRIPVQIVASGAGLEVRPATTGAKHFGGLVAQPSPVGGDRYENYTCGTSMATALAARAAQRISETLLDLDGGSNHADIDPRFMALAVKALLVHGSQWSSKAAVLDEMFEPQGKGSHLVRRDDIARLLGYGVPEINRVLDCTSSRATLLGWGEIGADTFLRYRIPLPDDLDGKIAGRTAAVTLAWFSPVNPRHKGYRVAALDVSAASDEKYWIVEDRHSLQPTDKAVVRGTVFHERRLGESAKVFVDDGHLVLRVSCRATAGELLEPVPFALAVSFEVAADAGIPVYQRIREKLDLMVQAQIKAPV